MDPGSTQPSGPRETVGLACLLAATFLIRAIHPGQPIVENYVGRQIPTAMVARNIQRGSGFLHPELDTGPFPNRFLVEPPIYAQVVATAATRLNLPLAPTGRIVSALATTLAAWGLFGLARRREGVAVALLAVAAFAVLPVMVRYGRAFQPDALMLGAVLVGLRGWDEWANGDGDRGWLWIGAIGLSLGLALKVIVGWVLLPFGALHGRWPWRLQVAVAAPLLVPALVWYALVFGELRAGTAGSAASADNAAIWAGTLGVSAWLRPETWMSIARALVVGAFGPVGFGLAVWGWAAGGRIDPVWRAWAGGVALSVVGLAAKWHHGYYWMTVAPLAAVGIGRGLVALGRFGKVVPPAAFLLFAGGCVMQSVSTWRTPGEWAALPEVARTLAAATAPTDWVIAPEAVLFFADRRGCRLEFEPAAARRAAGEWGGVLADANQPLALTEFYRSHIPEPPNVFQKEPDRARWVADVGTTEPGDRRHAWRQSLRSLPNIRIVLDRPDAFIAELP